ncbi:MAG: hypothetical protein JNL01_02430 [Bdellovibrionales bacterium]|nr:hypothetical protein [Bdellovibrionales bacterium]
MFQSISFLKIVSAFVLFFAMPQVVSAQVTKDGKIFSDRELEQIESHRPQIEQDITAKKARKLLKKFANLEVNLAKLTDEEFSSKRARISEMLKKKTKFGAQNEMPSVDDVVSNHHAAFLKAFSDDGLTRQQIVSQLHATKEFLNQRANQNAANQLYSVLVPSAQAQAGILIFVLVFIVALMIGSGG